MNLPRFRIPRPDVDARDVHIYGGLALAALGGWQLSAPVTCVALGCVLLVLGVFGPRLGRRV